MDTAPTEFYPLSLHDALPIWLLASHRPWSEYRASEGGVGYRGEDHTTHLLRMPRIPQLARARSTSHLLRNIRERRQDRKSTRLNSSHRCISYAVFCLKKKNKT